MGGPGESRLFAGSNQRRSPVSTLILSIDKKSRGLPIAVLTAYTRKSELWSHATPSAVLSRRRAPIQAMDNP